MGYAVWGVVTGQDFKRVAAELREMDARLPAQFRRELRQRARPLAEVAKSRVLAIPTHGHRHSGLRRRIARGVGVRVRASKDPGVDIVSTMKDASERHLPRYLDRQSGWRHPVFGHDRWVSQHTGGSWFDRPIGERAPEIRDGLIDVLNEAARKIH